MTPLRQRMIEDMRIRNFATTTQRSYVHYVAEFAKYFHRDPAELDLDAVRQYQLHLSQERKLSPQSINTFVSAVQFLYLVTLELPWEKHDFPRARLDEKLPVVPVPAHEPREKDRPDPHARFTDLAPAPVGKAASPLDLLLKPPKSKPAKR